jgi:hypothetical protein
MLRVEGAAQVGFEGAAVAGQPLFRLRRDRRAGRLEGERAGPFFFTFASLSTCARECSLIRVHPTPPPLPTDLVRPRPGVRMLTAAFALLPPGLMILAVVWPGKMLGALWLLSSLVCLLWAFWVWRRERWLGIVCSVLSLAQFTFALVMGLLLRNAGVPLFAHTPTVMVASFQGDFQPDQPKAGWRYLWNANAPVEDSNAYSPLQWDGQRYTSGNSYPGPMPVHYLRITERGGHPGHGCGQAGREGNEIAHYAIFAFTVPASGRYGIIESLLSRSAHTLGGQLDLRVFVNSREAGPTVICRSRDGVSFDRPLGKLSRGDMIYVAVGPGETDSDDGFTLDFTIAR